MIVEDTKDLVETADYVIIVTNNFLLALKPKMVTLSA